VKGFFLHIIRAQHSQDSIISINKLKMLHAEDA